MDIKLKDFEGPLDLLLHLVSKYQMDIYQVPLVEVIEQYLAYVAGLAVLRLEVAGDYMVMASQLMLIKSRRLLPKLVEEAPLEDDPEQVLLSQLEEYRLYKEASKELANQHDERALYFSKPKQELVVEDMTLVHDRTSMDLFLAFSKVMAAQQEKWRTSHTSIEVEDHKIEDLMVSLSQQLAKEKQLTFSQVLETSQSLNQAITLFLATLELVKRQQIQVSQAENFGQVLLIWQDLEGSMS